ncbi:hypothetical protein [Streptomyces massasporeus]|uniref:hypothetical protein n=1 Tax=Streptomyces massasporeus TaxID=67324 RepID=UPI0037F97432
MSSTCPLEETAGCPRLGQFAANVDLDRAARARELLDLVDGSAYPPESERVAEIQQALGRPQAGPRGRNGTTSTKSNDELH